ncbi:hypothetical protein KBTX_04027 [wastewater metagenome]|uniref:HTH tetR-type domain-containing protein n=2 Tax=unclassified sequences TaxID=12908 RepID=A0A5B8RKX9_9ZZZZ|nr:TetR/AcrR family transcriptional regulator [Arhodomonas sp. KWT]QEA07667.1 hypothetical protein KBTEX_04027 [uncultured organism]
MTVSKRDALLDTAERLFYTEGFHATGIERLVSEAGVARMTLYHHFPAKEALVAAVLARRHHHYLAMLRTALDDATGDPIAGLVDAHCGWLAEYSAQGCMLVKAMGEYEHHDPAVHSHALACKREVIGVIREAAARDGAGDPERLAGRIYLVLEGATQALPVVGAERTRADARALLGAMHGRGAP